MKKAMLFSASVAVLAMPTMASALDVKISGNIESKLTYSDTFTDNNDTYQGSGTVFSASTATAHVAVGVVDGGSSYFDDTVADAEIVDSTEGDIDFAVSASNCCFNYGGMAGLKLNAEGGAVTVDDAHIYIQSATMGKFEAGIDESGTQGVFDRDVRNVGPVGVSSTVWNSNDDIGDTFTGSDVAGTRFSWEYDLSGFGLAVAYDPEKNAAGDASWAASGSYGLNLGGTDVKLIGAVTSTEAMGIRADASISGFDMTVGYAKDGDDENSLYLGATTSFGGIKLGIEAAMNKASGTVDRAAASYETHTATLAANTALGVATAGTANACAAAGNGDCSSTHTSEDTQIAINASYDLAPGLTLSGGVAMYDAEGTDTFNEAAQAGADTMSYTNSVSGTAASVRLKLSF